MDTPSRDLKHHPTEPEPPPEPPGAAELSLDIAPWGPDAATVDTVRCRLFDYPAVQEFLAGTRHRLLALQFLEAEGKTAEPVLSDRYRATIYDYTNNRTIFVDGCCTTSDLVLVSESASQPLPTPEEFQEAVEILTGHPDYGQALREQVAQPYPAMPPLVFDEVELPDGRVERTLAIGLLPNDDQIPHEIVGVNLITRQVSRFPGGGPRGSAGAGGICGIPYTPQPTARNIPGQAWITVTQGGQLLWKFLVVRPAASSGTNGSGVELRYVDYRGKRVLYRGHVPILNVKYDGPCGPYRDWQNMEGMIQANGIDVAPGFRLANSPAQTFIDTGSDAGNFLGVAIYVQGQEVVLVSEMEAGWYRYISEWRLHADGTIRPRFGFSAVRNACVCYRHHHHVYWRLDFDIRTPGNNIVREFNDPPLIGNSNWHAKQYEIKRFRSPAYKRKWRVENTLTGEAYDIIPGPNDGVASTFPDWPFSLGDIWLVRYRGSEIDDGVVAIGPPYEATVLDAWVNGEVINSQDVVVWYAGHVTHDFNHEPPGSFGHVVGPELKPVNW